MVSIIILSYNTEALLRNCLASIYKHIKDIEFEVIVVDNASSDASVEMVKKEFKQVKLIENKKNVGFAAGCNLGEKHAKGEYILFLNSDTELKNNTVKDAIDRLRQDDNLAIVGGALQNQNGTTSHSYGHFFTLLETFIMLSGIEHFNKQQSQKEKLVDWVSGGCMLVKRSIFEKIKGFDEHFFMYIEDVELCYRIKHLGYDMIYYPNFVVSHRAQGSSSRGFAIEHIYRGLLYFYKKHKTFFSYQLLRLMLYSKAYSAIAIGLITNNNSLLQTYRRVERVI